MPVTGIFSISHNIFYPSQKKYEFFGYIYFVVCKCFEFGQVENFVDWERVNLSAYLYHYDHPYKLCTKLP